MRAVASLQANGSMVTTFQCTSMATPPSSCTRQGTGVRRLSLWELHQSTPLPESQQAPGKLLMEHDIHIMIVACRMQQGNRGLHAQTGNQ